MFFTPGFGQFIKVFLTDPLKICQTAWKCLNYCLQVSPQMVRGV